MKKFIKPEIEMVKFTSEDFICTSGIYELVYGKGDKHIGIDAGNKDFGYISIDE